MNDSPNFLKLKKNKGRLKKKRKGKRQYLNARGRKRVLRYCQEKIQLIHKIYANNLGTIKRNAIDSFRLIKSFYCFFYFIDFIQVFLFKFIC